MRVHLTGMATAPQQIKFFYRWSSILFVLAVLSLLISTRYRSLTLDYSIRALVIGAFYSILVLRYGKWESKQNGGPLLALLSIVLLVGGFFWSSNQAFGIAHAGQSLWMLAAQFFPTAFSLFFAALFVHRRWSTGK